MAGEDGQERTERATPKRLREAREKGQIPRSREFNTMALLMGLAGAMLLIGDDLLSGVAEMMHKGLIIERTQVFDTTVMISTFGRTLQDALWLLTPFFLVALVIALVAPLAIGGWGFSFQAVSFKWEKLDPVKGLKRLFAWRGLVELLKAIAKFLLVATVSVLMLWHLAGEFLSLGSQSLAQGMAHAAHLYGWAFLVLSATLVVIAAVDVPFQLWDHARQLRMTRQEVKDEFKETEGHPELRARIRAAQREMAQRRMMEDVPKADVVVTNPTHFAVALKYDQDKMRAPRLVAKGTDLVAGHIRRVAAANGVPVFEAPPLARALYHSTDIGREIPAGLYVAVAQVLAYVYQVKVARRQGGVEPSRPSNLPVPDELLDKAPGSGASDDEPATPHE
jgi:flagellar biosynthetic protein FlhB